MPNKIRRILSIAGIVTIVIAAVLIVIAIIDKKAFDNIPEKSVVDMTPIEIAFSMSETNDDDRILELGDELFTKRDKTEVKEALTADNLIICQAIYLTAVISNNDLEKYSKQTILFTNDMIKTDAEKYFLTLFDQIYKKTVKNAQKQYDICEKLINNPIDFENIDNQIYYKTFLYYISASIKSDKTPILDKELRILLEDSNVDYNDFFEQERLLYCISAFKAKYYVAFVNIFLESNNDEHEPSSMLISYLINSDLDDESRTVLINSLEKLIDQTDISNTNKINGLKGFLKILKAET